MPDCWLSNTVILDKKIDHSYKAKFSCKVTSNPNCSGRSWILPESKMDRWLPLSININFALQRVKILVPSYPSKWSFDLRPPSPFPWNQLSTRLLFLSALQSITSQSCSVRPSPKDSIDCFWVFLTALAWVSSLKYFLLHQSPSHFSHSWSSVQVLRFLHCYS